MWQSSTKTTFRDRELFGLEAWVYVFAKTWESLEHDRKHLRMTGFNVFGPAVAEKHGNEDPAVVARRLYPEAGEYSEEIYPGFPAGPVPPAAPLTIVDGDVPF